jgi:hypothetical protein
MAEDPCPLYFTPSRNMGRKVHMCGLNEKEADQVAGAGSAGAKK